jgi:TonB-linked SusC/RagA family outer membrane protein
MRKFALLLTCLLLCGIHVVFAQSRTVTGKVTDVDDGSTLPGVSVVVKGTSIGTVTDIDGKFSLVVPSDAKVLRLSFVGFETKEIALTPANNYNVVFEKATFSVDEVVVTALGVSREKKALGYSVAEVKGEELNKARGGESNPLNSLAGKVAGLQVTGASGNIGGSSKIVLRGVKSLSGSNQPLFIIDGVPLEGTDYNTTDAARGAGGFDYGNLIQDINPDDIASISVLKGPNASALYGSRASNGVVMITTKKGAKGKGLGITFNTSLGFEKVNKLPVMQNEYGGGYSDFIEAEINGKTFNAIDYGTDESWGPKYDSNKDYLSWYDLAKWEDGGKKGDPTTSKWTASKNDIDKFFELGTSLSNNISISKATDNASIRASFSNMKLNGYMPNSSLDKNSFNISGTAGDNKYYEFSSNITYLSQKAKGRPETGYGDNNVMQKFIQWGQRQLDMKELKSMYQYSNGTQAGWNRVGWDDPTLNYSNNPYWSRYMNYQNDTRDRIYGNIGLKINIIESLKFQYKLNLDYFSDKQYERNAVYSQEQSRYYEAQRQQHEINHEFLLLFNKKVSDISINVNAGANLMSQSYERIDGESVGGLVLPNFYNLSNSVSTAKATNLLREKSINSVFASGSLGYKNFAYLDLTARNDWSSTLPAGSNSYFYPSVTASFVFSELLKVDAISFGKFRLGWAQVGGDTDPYRVLDTYTFYTSYEGTHAYILPLSKKNLNLKPEITTSYEAGLEMAFFNGRLSFDATAYYGETKNQILPLSLSGTTGYTSQIINAGLISNKGLEFLVKGEPVKSKNFGWNITGTISANKNQVVELLPGVNYFRLASAPFKVEVGAYVGEKYGEIMGTDFIYDDKGNKVVDADGYYEYTSGNVPLGSVYPDIMYGLSNSFRYRNLELSVLFDGQTGGKFFSTSFMWGVYSGMLDETAGKNELGNPIRDAVADGGGVLITGKQEDGTDNTVRIEGQAWAEDIYTGPAARSVFKSDFVKLREITLTYSVPLKASAFVEKLTIAAYGRNLALWGPDTKHFDPEMATTNSGNVQGIEGGALPSIATFGINVGIQF